MALAPVAAMDALTNPTPNHLTEAVSDENGMYTTDCVDLTMQSLGILILSDDAGFDGTGGNFYPTYSGVLSIESNEDKTCVDAPTIFGVPNAFVTGLTAVPPLANITTDGLGIVLITDAATNPVEGAVLKKSDPDGSNPVDLPNNAVIYPNADFSAFDGTATAAHGIVLVAGPMGLDYVIPIKDGMTWGAEPMAIVAGFCLTRPILAQP
jgi:hypothetical protein